MIPSTWAKGLNGFDKTSGFVNVKGFDGNLGLVSVIAVHNKRCSGLGSSLVNTRSRPSPLNFGVMHLYVKGITRKIM